MKNIINIIILLTLSPMLLFSQKNYWTSTNNQTATKLDFSSLKKYRSVDINTSLLRSELDQAPKADANYKTDAVYYLDIPNPEGGTDRFKVMEIAVLSPALAAKYPSIKTYKLIGKNGATGRLTLSDFGIGVAVHKGQGSFHIESASKDDNEKHIIYFDRDQASAGYRCGTENLSDVITPLKRSSFKSLGDCQLRSYRMAIATTGQFTTLSGGQTATMASITTTLNNISDIYERDATITFTLVSTNSIFYTNAATDPFDTTGFPKPANLAECNTAITTELGAAGFDIGHVFHQYPISQTGGAGLATRGVVCAINKGRAASASNVTSGSKWEKLVAHEIAHNFNATHTMSSGTGQCGGTNMYLPTAFEIGGGSTLMAYSNICTGTSYQQGSDDYFHSGSLSQIVAFASTNTCATTTPITNANPLVVASAPAYFIPKSTPFVLTATGSDPNGNNNLYNWEQIDASLVALSAWPTSITANGPMFRSVYPTTNGNVRYFPALSSIVDGTTQPYEVLPSIGREMNFRVTARDNAAGNGCLAYDSTKVTTHAAAGPFSVTSQTAATNWVANGTNTATITWNVAGTTTAPVSCANVDILFSDDGGITFPHVLIASTPNDGSEAITIPNLNACEGRIMVKCSDNIFINVNGGIINLTSACVANGTTISPSTIITTGVGNPILNFIEAPQYGNPTAISGMITNADALGNLIFFQSYVPGCFFSSQTNYYDTHTFRVNVAGNYTLTLPPATGLVTNLYKGSFDPLSGCQNWLASNHTQNIPSNPLASSPSLPSVSLCPGIDYTVVISSFNTAVALPQAYTITASVTPVSGGLFTTTPNPGVGYDYDYVVVNKTTGNIVTFLSSPLDMTNTATYPLGSYEIVGLSHATANTITALRTAYNGTSFATFKSTVLTGGALCANLSTNSRLVHLTIPLPINMTELVATKVGNKSLLRWSTLLEKNSLKFEVERSGDATNYEKIGAVNSAGNSSVKLDYDFTDEYPLTGNNFYRLKNIDKDGSTSFSNVVNVKHSLRETSIRLYPNPAKSMVRLAIQALKNQNAEIIVTDLLGKVLINRIEYIEAGTNKIELLISSLAKGNYIIRYKSQEISLIEKLTIQ